MNYYWKHLSSSWTPSRIRYYLYFLFQNSISCNFECFEEWLPGGVQLLAKEEATSAVGCDIVWWPLFWRCSDAHVNHPNRKTSDVHHAEPLVDHHHATASQHRHRSTTIERFKIPHIDLFRTSKRSLHLRDPTHTHTHICCPFGNIYIFFYIQLCEVRSGRAWWTARAVLLLF